MSNSGQGIDVAFRFHYLGSALWVAVIDSRWGPVEFLASGSEEKPDQDNLEAFGRFLPNANERVLNLRRQLPSSWLYRPIRVAINEEGIIGVQFQHRIFRSRQPLIQESAVA